MCTYGTYDDTYMSADEETETNAGPRDIKRWGEAVNHLNILLVIYLVACSRIGVWETGVRVLLLWDTVHCISWGGESDTRRYRVPCSISRHLSSVWGHWAVSGGGVLEVRYMWTWRTSWQFWGVHFRSLKEGYSDRALCWETLAQRHWVDIKHDALTGIYSTSHNTVEMFVVRSDCPMQTLWCVCVAHCASGDELCAVEENTEKCYREGLEVVSEPALLWRHYIRWCLKRVEDKHMTDAARLRVSLSQSSLGG